MRHPTPKQLSSYLDGETDPKTEQTIRDHLAVCAQCRASIGQIRALRQAIWATRPVPPEPAHPAQFLAGLRRRIPASQLRWQSVILIGPALFVVAAMAAKLLMIAIVGDNLLQRAGLVSSGPVRIARLAANAATSPLVQRTVGSSLGWTQDQLAASTSDLASRLQNTSTMQLLPGLILIVPMALITGVGVLGLGCFFCWAMRDRGE